MPTMLKIRAYLTTMLAGLAVGLLSLPTCRAEGGDWSGDRFVIKGFGTLGLARSDSNDAEYVRDLSQPRGLTTNWSAKLDSLLGLQGNLKLNEQTEGVVQVISRYRYDGSHRPEISWAFLRRECAPDFEFRLGRLGTEFYMLADSRLIGYANLTVRPPPDFYGPLIFSYFDGLDATASRSLGNALLRAKLFVGRSPETTPYSDPITWDISGSRLFGGHLDFFTGPWQFRLAHAEVKFSSREAPLGALLNQIVASNPAWSSLIPSSLDLIAQIPELGMANTTSRFDSLGLVYDKGPLQLQAMLGRIRHASASYEDSRAAFVTAAYRLGKFAPYAGYSIAKSKTTNITTIPAAPWGPLLVQVVENALVPATHMDQHTFTLGTRWDFQRNWAMKLQLDAVRGDKSSSILFRGAENHWKGRMNVLSVAFDFAF